MRALIILGCLVGVPAPVAFAQFAVGGIAVDARGLVRAATKGDRPILPTVPTANDEVARPSAWRIVSLARIEVALSNECTEDDRALVALAGLQRVGAVHLLTDDVLIAGPAEGWQVTDTGDLVGSRSKRPTLRLDDLVVALRYAFSEDRVDAFVGCSIDPTPEGLRRVSTLGIGSGRRAVRDATTHARNLELAMGPQAVRVFGVSPRTPFALGLVAADVQLKRLAMGHEPSGIEEVVSYTSLLARGRGSSQSPLSNRFWFVGHYDAIHASADDRVFEFEGSGFRVRASAPARLADRDRNLDDEAAATSPAGRFAESCGIHAERLADLHPELAALQNRIGLAVVAELTARPHLVEDSEFAIEPEAAGSRFWYPSRLLDPEFHDVPTLESPRFVPSLAGVVPLRGGRQLVHVSGGVEIDPSSLVRTCTKAATQTRSIAPRPDDPDRWWWDAVAE